MLNDLSERYSLDIAYNLSTIKEDLSPAQALDQFVTVVEKDNLFSHDLSSEYFVNMLKQYANNLKSMYAYERKEAVSRLIFIKATEKTEVEKSVSEQASEEIWQKHVKSTMNSFSLNGDHYSILTSPSVEKLAHLLIDKVLG